MPFVNSLVFIILSFAIGFVVGAVLIWFFTANKKGALIALNTLLGQTKQEKQETEKSLIKTQTLLNQTREETQKQSTEIQHLRQQLLQAEKTLSALQTEKDSRQNLQNQFEEHFKNLSQDILSAKSKQFHTQATQDIQRLLDPLKEKIEHFQKKVEDTYSNESKERFSLKERIGELCRTHEQLKEENPALI